ncbi:Ribonuclease H-like protein [Dioscorea alata]|uniref:Ribonuclease H-like protein n=1 Tax=Dioscorea alata TaxID=55571 RepID=A0ACB7TYN1_DIOAL|nr:Ribonuclease H-like protein [Dioscorea alata]
MGHLKRHAAKQHDSTQTQISFTDSTFGTFVCNNENARKEIGRKCKKYLIDVDHRWNSTYEMLECAYDDRDITSMFCNNKFPEDQVTNYDWEVSNLIKEFLKIFYTSTNIFSGVYYATTSVIVNQIFFISEVFARYRHDPNVALIVAPMEVKFKKYF